MAWSVFFLGLLGSVGHCTGMCGGVALLLGRADRARGGRLLLVHLGRLTTYTLLGGLLGSLGAALGWVSGRPNLNGQLPRDALHAPGLAWIQGVLALLAGLLALYMAAALLGRAPSPELALSRVTRWWGRAMRRAAPARPDRGLAAWATPFALGLLWGLLPCGLVMAALLVALVAGSPGASAGTMLLFGLGTLPLTLGITLFPRLAGAWPRRLAPRLRPLTAGILVLFGVQLALRGLVAWGWIGHARMGGLILW